MLVRDRSLTAVDIANSVTAAVSVACTANLMSELTSLGPVRSFKTVIVAAALIAAVYENSLVHYLPHHWCHRS